MSDIFAGTPGLGIRIQPTTQLSFNQGAICLAISGCPRERTSKVLVNGNELHLNNQQFRCLRLLATNPGVCKSKDDFLDYLYKGRDNPPGPKIIDVLICTLRKKLARAGAEGILHTVSGHGYLLESDSLSESSDAASKAAVS